MLSPSPKTPVTFLEALRPAPWVLTAIVPDGIATTITARTSAEVEAFVQQHDGRRNLYFSVNPLRRAVTRKPTKADVAAIEFVFADLDPATGESPEAAKTRYCKALEQEPETTFLIDSGNGLQALWRLDKLVDPSGAADVEARSKAIMERLGAKAGTQNIDRILRLPGTRNLPNAKKKREGRQECSAELIEHNDIAHALGTFAPGQARAHESGPILNIDFGDLPEVDISALPISDKIRDAIDSDGAELGDGDRSDAVFYMCCALIRAGLSDAQVASVIWHNEIGAHCRDQADPERSIRRAVTKARREVPRGEEFERVEPDANNLFNSYSIRESQISDFTNTQLIKGLLDSAAVLLIYGASGQFKSFAALKVAFHVATGRPLNGRKVKQGLVVYIPLEGTRAFKKRVNALLKTLEPGEPAALEIIEDNFRLTAKADIARLLATIRALEKKHGAPCRLVIVDTLSKASPGIDEDKVKEVGVVFGNLEAIKREIGCTVGVVHHEGKDSSRGPRGSSSIHAGIDAEFRVRDKILTVTKQRDGEGEVEIRFVLDKVVLGHDEDGDEVSTLVVRWLTADDDFPVATPLQQRAIDALAFCEASIELIDPIAALPPDAPKGVPAVPVAAWREALFDRGVLKRNAKNNREPFRRLKLDLIAQKEIAEVDGFIWCTSPSHRHSTTP